jgi:hypothetical protein
MPKVDVNLEVFVENPDHLAALKVKYGDAVQCLGEIGNDYMLSEFASYVLIGDPVVKVGEGRTENGIPIVEDVLFPVRDNGDRLVLARYAYFAHKNPR